MDSSRDRLGPILLGKKDLAAPEKGTSPTFAGWIKLPYNTGVHGRKYAWAPRLKGSISTTHVCQLRYKEVGDKF